MIMVAGSPFPVSALEDKYPANSVERQVLDQMAAGNEVFRYGSVPELEFELSMRREIVNAARALYRSGMGFAVFLHSVCNPAYWDRMENGGFRKKRDIAAQDAIRDIFNNGRAYATECATAMMIVYYGALLELFSPEIYNRRFSSIELMDWHNLDPLLRQAGTPRKTDTILPGDRCYFKNPEVDPKTPQWQGENVIVLPGGLYYGHGIGITTADRIIRALNENRKPDATQSAFFMDAAARPNFKQLWRASEPVLQTQGPLSWRLPPPLPAAARRV